MIHHAEREAFVAEIRRTGEPLAILMYADWLEEQGDGLADVLRDWQQLPPHEDSCDAAAELMCGLFYAFEPTDIIWIGANFVQRAAIVCRVYETYEIVRDVVRRVRLTAQHRTSARELKPWKLRELAESCSEVTDGHALSAAYSLSLAAWCVEFDSPTDLPLLAAGAGLDAAAAIAAHDINEPDSRLEELNWQVNHVLKSTILGRLPLTDVEQRKDGLTVGGDRGGALASQTFDCEIERVACIDECNRVGISMG